MHSACRRPSTKSADAIRNVPDFPKPGIQFKDITPVLADARLFRRQHRSADRQLPARVDRCRGRHRRPRIHLRRRRRPQAPGRLCAGPQERQAALPHLRAELTTSNTAPTPSPSTPTRSSPAQRVLLIDDLLATGGTAEAAAALVQKVGARIAEIGFLIELGFLNGRERLKGIPIRSLVVY